MDHWLKRRHKSRKREKWNLLSFGFSLESFPRLLRVVEEMFPPGNCFPLPVCILLRWQGSLDERPSSSPPPHRDQP